MHKNPPRKSGDNGHVDDTDGESILHIQTNSQGPIEERFVPADRKGFGHMATVVVGKRSGRDSLDSVSSNLRTERDIVMTRTMVQSTSSRL